MLLLGSKKGGKSRLFAYFHHGSALFALTRCFIFETVTPFSAQFSNILRRYAGEGFGANPVASMAITISLTDNPRLKALVIMLATAPVIRSAILSK